jgi:hypothetical protein
MPNKVIENVRKFAKDIRINQVITSENASKLFENFQFLYDL